MMLSLHGLRGPLLGLHIPSHPQPRHRRTRQLPYQRKPTTPPCSNEDEQALAMRYLVRPMGQAGT